MASQWNEEFMSQFTPVVTVDQEENRTLCSEDERHAFMQTASDGGFVSLNSHHVEMPDLDLYMRTDLSTKADEIVNGTDSHSQHQAQHALSHNGFENSDLGLVTSAASILIDHADLETGHFVSSSQQLRELVPHCLQSLGSDLEVPITEGFQAEGHSSTDLLQQVDVNENQRQHHQQHHVTQSLDQHLESHLDSCQFERSTAERVLRSPADLLLSQTIHFDDDVSHSHHHHHQQSHQLHDHAHSNAQSLLIPSEQPQLQLDGHNQSHHHHHPQHQHLQQQQQQHHQQLQQQQQIIVTTQQNVSQSHLHAITVVKDTLPAMSLHHNDDDTHNILATTSASLSSKLTALVSESSSDLAKSASSLGSPPTTLSFMQSNPPLLQAISTIEPSDIESAGPSQSVHLADDHKVDASINGLVDKLCNKAKKRKMVHHPTNGDMVWVNCKDVESRQRDRQATQALIDIVSSLHWQQKLNCPTTKKKTVWKGIGDEFISKGYFLENPGQKCFQKWRNLERTFKEYELSKTLPSTSSKPLPDFYVQLQPVLKEKLSFNGLMGENGSIAGVDNDKLLGKYVEFDSKDANSLVKSALRSDSGSDEVLEDVFKNCPQNRLQFGVNESLCCSSSSLSSSLSSSSLSVAAALPSALLSPSSSQIASFRSSAAIPHPNLLNSLNQVNNTTHQVSQPSFSTSAPSLSLSPCFSSPSSSLRTLLTDSEGRNTIPIVEVTTLSDFSQHTNNSHSEEKNNSDSNFNFTLPRTSKGPQNGLHQNENQIHNVPSSSSSPSSGKCKPWSASVQISLMSSLVEGLQAQKKELVEMNSTLHSIHGLLKEQKKERQAAFAESQRCMSELTSTIDANQKKKMAFMYQFLTLFKQNKNASGSNHQHDDDNANSDDDVDKL